MTEVSEPGGDGAPRRRVTWRWRSLLASVVPVVCIVAACFALDALHTEAYPKISPIDEQAHVDYLYKLRDGHVIRPGELMGQRALDEANCRGIDSPYQPPPCDEIGDYDPSAFVWGGVNSAASHTPFYYAGTIAAAEPIDAVAPFDSYMTSARIASSLWLAAALSLMWFVLRRAGVSVLMRASIVAILGTAPAVIHASFTVNPDATALLAGALMLWLATRTVRPPAWAVFLVSLCAVAPKATNIIAVCCAALIWLLGDWAATSGVPLRARVRAIVGSTLRLWPMALGAAIVPIAWAVTTRARVVPVAEGAGILPSSPLTVDLLLSHIVTFLPPTRGAYLPGILTEAGVTVPLSMNLVDVALLGATLGGWMFLARWTLEWRVAAASVGGMLLGPYVILALIFVSSGSAFALPSRYGLPILPFAAFMLGAVPRRTLASGFVVIAAVSSTAAITHALIVAS